MRIIAGTARSMPLKTVRGTDTRPTADRIKETLFNMIQYDVPGARFLDLFAGSGGIGLEAISRGAASAVFVDNSRKAAACIEDNIRFTKFDEKCECKCMDVLSAIRMMDGRYEFDLVFLDPPYGKGLSAQALSLLASARLIHEDTLLIVEESITFDPQTLNDCGLAIFRIKQYKTNQHIFLKKRSENENCNLSRKL